MITFPSLFRGNSQNPSTPLMTTSSVHKGAQSKAALEAILVVEQIVYRASI